MMRSNCGSKLPFENMTLQLPDFNILLHVLTTIDQNCAYKGRLHSAKNQIEIERPSIGIRFVVFPWSRFCTLRGDITIKFTLIQNIYNIYIEIEYKTKIIIIIIY